jgi:hypothetical protein
VGIDRPSGTDGRVEDADKPPPPERPPGPPPDRPGEPGFPSRLESLAAARESQAARAAERERQRTAAPENGTEPPEAQDEEAVESSPAEPTGEQQNDQEGQEETEAAGKSRESLSGLGERDTARPESEAAEELRRDESEAQPGAAETGELPPEPDAEQSDTDQDEEAKPFSDQAAAEEPDPPAEAEAAEDSPDPRDAEPEAGQAGRPDGPGEDQRTQDSGNQDAGETPPQAPDERDRPESRDHMQPPQQDGHSPGTGGPGAETATGQILQADRQPGLQGQGSQDAPGPVPAEQSEGTSDVQPPTEGDMQRTADGQFTPPEMPEQSDAPVSRMAEPLSPEEGSTQLASPVVDVSERNLGSQPESSSRDAADRREAPAITGNLNETKRQQDLGTKMAELAEKKIHTEVNEALEKVNPKFDVARSAYSENCTGVVQANELRRRGEDAEAGPLEKHLRTDEGGPGGRSLSTIEKAWGGKFVPGTKAEIEEAFKQPGSRGIVYIAWNGPGGGAHVFNVENVGGKVRYVDGQPTPPTRDASHYFALGRATKYLRVDDRPTPSSSAIDPYLEP